MLNQISNHIIGSFYISVMMTTFCWIGLADFAWYEAKDSIDQMPVEIVEYNQLPLSLAFEINVIAKASRYESTRVGSSAMLSSNEIAFNQIINSPDAANIFTYLMHQNNVVSKIYALKGFQWIESPMYHHYIPYFKGSQMTVKTQSGCSVFDVKVPLVLDRLTKRLE